MSKAKGKRLGTGFKPKKARCEFYEQRLSGPAFNLIPFKRRSGTLSRSGEWRLRLNYPLFIILAVPCEVLGRSRVRGRRWRIISWGRKTRSITQVRTGWLSSLVRSRGRREGAESRFCWWITLSEMGSVDLHALAQTRLFLCGGITHFFLRQDSALLPKWIAEKTAVKGAWNKQSCKRLHTISKAVSYFIPFRSHSLEQVLMGGHARLYFPYFHCKEVPMYSGFSDFLLCFTRTLCFWKPWSSVGEETF